MSDGYLIPSPFIYDFLGVLTYVTLQGREIGFGDIVEESVQVITLVWCIEIATKEQNQFVNQLWLIKDVALQIIVDDVEHKTAINDILSGSFLLAKNCISSTVKCRYRARNAKPFVDFIPEFANGFICERYYKYLLRLDTFLLDQITDLGCNCSRLACSSTCYYKCVIFIRENYITLLIIEIDYRIYCLEDCIKIFLLALQVTGHVGFVVLFYRCRDSLEIFKIFVEGQKFLNPLFLQIILLAIKGQCLCTLLPKEEVVDVSILMHDSLVVTDSEILIAI